MKVLSVLTSLLFPLAVAALFLGPAAVQAAPDLSVAKTCAASSQSILCTITITNIGDVPSVSPISLTDNVTGSTTVNLTGGGGSLPASCTPGAQVINNVPISCPSINTSLAAGASGTVLFSFTMPQGGTFTNCVSVSQGQNPGTQPDPDPANNTNICTTIAVNPPASATGSITIVKDAQPNDAQDFSFSSNQATIAPFLLDDDSDATLSNQKVFANLGAGSYTFTENQVSGWTLASIACTPSGGTSVNLTTGTASIVLAAGDNVICTFTNTKNPGSSITIVKDAQPNDAQDFSFSSNQATIAPFLLDDDSDATLSNQKVFANLGAGSYTFTENQVSGWTLTSIACTPSGGTSVNLTTGTASIALAAGDNVTCTFTNVKTAPVAGEICGIKFNDLDGNGVQDASDLGIPNWAISLNVASIPPTTTGINGEYCFSGLPAGVYTVSEIPQAPWQQTFPSAAAAGTHTVTLVAGQQINGINFGNTIPAGTCNALSGSSFSLLANGSFEDEQVVGAGSSNVFNESLISAWDTTAVNNMIKVHGSGSGGVNAYSGNQFIELNANALYQSFTATPGSTITLSFAHRGRAGFPNQMSVAIGPVNGIPVTLGTFTASVTAWTVVSVSYTFPANGVTAYELSFSSGNAAGGGNFLDAIEVIDTACEAVSGDTGMPLVDELVFAFLEDSYPLLFPGDAVAGQHMQYSYRYYAASRSYLAIDNEGMVFAMGPFTDNVITPLGEVESFRRLIAIRDTGPIANSRVFDFAEAMYPELFKGAATAGQAMQYSYRFYAETGTYLAVDNAGMIYILGPLTGNAIRGVGSVESFRDLITTWETSLR